MGDVMKVFSVIDIGSNSVRMTVYKIINGKLESIKKVRKYVRLSEGMEKDNLLKEAAVSRTLNALVEVNKMSGDMGAGDVFAVATAAVRRSENARDFLRRAKDKTGLDIKVLSGREEAEYGFLAVSKSIDYKNTVIVDVGGGSAELTLVKNNKYVNSASLPLGAVILTERFKGKNQNELYHYIYEAFSSVDFLKNAEYFCITALGGTASTLSKVFNKREILKEEVGMLYGKLCELSWDERRTITGIEPERADIILAGVTVYKVLFDMISSPKMYYSHSNIRDGIAYELYDRSKNNEF